MDSKSAFERRCELDNAAEFLLDTLGHCYESLLKKERVLMGTGEDFTDDVLSCLSQSVRASVQLAKLGVELPTMLGQTGVWAADRLIGNSVRDSFPEGPVRSIGHVAAEVPFALSPRVWKGKAEKATEGLRGDLHNFENSFVFWLSHGTAPFHVIDKE